MKKSIYEVLSSLYLIAFCLVLFLTPIYFFDSGNYSFFAYCQKAGATILSYGGGILLFLLVITGILKIVVTFLLKKDDEKQEQYQFALYSVWIVLGLGYTMVSFQGQSMIAFGLGLVLALSGLLAFFLDYHLYGQD